MNTHFHAWIRHLNIQWNKNIQTECYIQLSKLQIKNATRQALRKKEHVCRAQRTRSQIADSATTKSERKNVFFFSSLAHFAEGALRRAKLENKRVGIFSNTQFFSVFFLSWNVIEHASTKREAQFFFRFYVSDLISKKRKRKRKAKRFCSFFFC